MNSLEIPILVLPRNMLRVGQICFKWQDLWAVWKSQVWNCWKGWTNTQIQIVFKVYSFTTRGLEDKIRDQHRHNVPLKQSVRPLLHISYGKIHFLQHFGWRKCHIKIFTIVGIHMWIMRNHHNCHHHHNFHHHYHRHRHHHHHCHHQPTMSSSLHRFSSSRLILFSCFLKYFRLAAWTLSYIFLFCNVHINLLSINS